MTTPKKKISVPPGAKSENGSPENPLPEDRPDFEQSLAELEGVVARMEEGELTLEETLDNFERGIELSKICQKALAGAQQRVRILTEKEGKFEIEPFGDRP
uniref:Exodeoxyribonuclease 7 small subunit n=1 Tax=Candidatus Kentrum eta TaxID=2126337 RepID=A0A450UDA3_9GAMM|nr:MAG: Exodeoxyribonuclease VII small subunit [Candidatus Kentron sp. H]VFJ90388.1 MAG: Exodeoxyribonuclease VII small subunit [Candidatus Kentron sp. H]VFJ97033.1 MAG: Exodeoxyribonuclease VII small subunit [Candidatus Kentron sp. H]